MAGERDASPAMWVPRMDAIVSRWFTSYEDEAARRLVEKRELAA